MPVRRATPAFPALPTGHPVPPHVVTHSAGHQSILDSELPIPQSMGKLLLHINGSFFLPYEIIYMQMFSCKRVSKCCHGKPQPSETNLQKEMSSTAAMSMPPRALKIKYTDLQLKPICWETNEGELAKIIFQPCLTIPINYCILKKLLLSQTLGFILLTTANGSHHVWK